MKTRCAVLLAALLITLMSSASSYNLAASTANTRIAVASNFTAPMQALADDFMATTGFVTQLSSGSSGKLYAQIQNGAPFDVFLSADNSKPQMLVSAGLAVEDTRFTYALGTLVLISRDNNEAALPRLMKGSYNKLAIANPRLAPYGTAALQTLDALKLTTDATARLVQGENISQTYQFVATGNAELGFVALSQVINNGVAPEGAWIVPSQHHDPIRQEAVLLTRGQHNIAATALLAYLQSDRAKAIISHFGYGISESAIAPKVITPETINPETMGP